MAKGILGRKIGMTQVFGEDGRLTPVTVVEAGPCVVLQKKTHETDGYESVQLGFRDKKESRANRPEKGHAQKAETTPKRYVQEIRGMVANDYEVGSEVTASIFENGEVVDVTGITKGKGFQGAIKRHGQSTGPNTHGSRYHRGPGAMAAVDASRVFKGKKLPGRMGHVQRTIQALEVVQVDTERNLLLIKGSVPGAKNSFVTIRSSVKSE